MQNPRNHKRGPFINDPLPPWHFPACPMAAGPPAPLRAVCKAKQRRAVVRLPEIGALDALISACKVPKDAGFAGSAPVDISAWVAQMAALHAKFAAYEAPFAHRARDMHWPTALEPAALVLPPDESHDEKMVIKHLLGWKHRLVGFMARLASFRLREVSMRGVADSLVSINGLSGEKEGFHCNMDAFDRVAAQGPTKAVVRDDKHVALLLPYFLRTLGGEHSMAPADWFSVVEAVVGQVQGPVPKDERGWTFQAYVHHRFIESPASVMALFQAAMSSQRRARKKALPAANPNGTAAQPPSGVTQHQLLPMRG